MTVSPGRVVREEATERLRDGEELRGRISRRGLCPGWEAYWTLDWNSPGARKRP